MGLANRRNARCERLRERQPERFQERRQYVDVAERKVPLDVRAEPGEVRAVSYPEIARKRLEVRSARAIADHEQVRARGTFGFANAFSRNGRSLKVINRQTDRTSGRSAGIRARPVAQDRVPAAKTGSCPRRATR